MNNTPMEKKCKHSESEVCAFCWKPTDIEHNPFNLGTPLPPGMKVVGANTDIEHESFNTEKHIKGSDIGTAWEERFDETFREYSFQKPPLGGGFEQDIKDFIAQVRQEGYEEGLEKGALKGERNRIIEQLRQEALTSLKTQIRKEVERKKLIESAFSSERLAQKQMYNKALDEVLSLPSLSVNE